MWLLHASGFKPTTTFPTSAITSLHLLCTGATNAIRSQGRHGSGPKVRTDIFANFILHCINTALCLAAAGTVCIIATADEAQASVDACMN